MRVYIRILLCFAVLFAAALSIRAADIVWTNTAGGNWSTAANWDPNQVPEASDFAVITNDGDYTVTLDVNVTVGGFVLGTTNGSYHPTLLIDSNTVTLGGALTNYGTIRWGNADWYGESSPQIYNYGLWDVQTDNTFHGGDSGGTTTFNNFGTFRKSGGNLDHAGTYFDFNTTFNNSGSVEIQSGALVFDHGSDSGTVNVASNAVFYPFTCTLTGGPNFAGGGSLQGYYIGSNAVLNGLMTFNYATLSGTLTIASNAVASLTARLTLPVSFNALVLTNCGTVNWSGVDLTSDSAQIYNCGLWDVQTDNMLSGGNSGTTFNNFGIFRKSGGNPGLGSTYLDFNTTFNNSGSVEIQSGALVFDHGSDSGTVNVASNTVFYPFTCTLTGGPNFAGGGSLQGYYIGSNAVLNGLMTFNYATLSGTLTIASNAVASLTARLTLPVSFNALVLTNCGTVNWSGVDLTSDSAQIYNCGLWDVQTDNMLSGGNSGTTFNNFGIFRKSGGNLDHAGTYFDFNTTFNNSGSVEIQSGALVFDHGSDSGTVNVASNTVFYPFTCTLTGGPNFAGGGSLQGYYIGSNAVLNGLMTFNYATLSGTLTIASNAVASLTARLTLPVSFNALVLTNCGTVNWSGVDLTSDSAQIYNCGLWDVQTDNMLSGGNSGTTFNNFGIFRKSGGNLDHAGTYFDFNTTFNNSGSVEIQSGALVFDHGSDSGTVNVASNAVFYPFTCTLTGGPNFAGGGSLQGYYIGSNAVLNGLMTFNYATLSGTLTIASNAVASLTARLTLPVSFNALVLTNCGTVNWSGVDLTSDSAQIYNCGLWDVQTDNMLSGGNSGTTFNNFGIFRKSGGNPGLGSTYLDFNTTFNNSGSVEIQSGALVFDHGSDSGTVNVASNTVFYPFTCTLTGGPNFAGGGSLQGYYIGSNAVLNGLMTFNYATLSGTLTIASNAVASLTARLTLPVSFNALVLTNCGTVNWSGVDLTSDSAQIYNCGLWDVQTDNMLSGGNSGTTFNNFGTFRKSGGNPGLGSTYLDFNTTFNNSGTMFCRVGRLAIGGSHTLTGGTLNFGINGASNFGSLDLNGNVILTGTVSANLQNNYAPVAGASFPVLTYGSQSGSFTSLKLPAGLAWQTNYGATTFTLSVAAVLPAQLSVTNSGNNTISFGWSVVPGQQYQVQYTTNLMSLNWINLGGLLSATNEILTASDTMNSDLQRFYRVVLIQ